MLNTTKDIKKTQNRGHKTGNFLPYNAVPFIKI